MKRAFRHRPRLLDAALIVAAGLVSLALFAFFQFCPLTVP